MTEQIKLEAINTSGGSQARAALCADAVAEFAEAMQLGADFPPVVLFKDGSTFWLADGFHRVTAAKQAGLDTILAEVHEGTLEDAILFAAGANATHGLRRTNEDKATAVKLLLSNPKWADCSDRWIADACKVSNHFVARVRADLADDQVGTIPPERELSHSGKDSAAHEVNGEQPAECATSDEAGRAAHSPTSDQNSADRQMARVLPLPTSTNKKHSKRRANTKRPANKKKVKGKDGKSYPARKRSGDKRAPEIPERISPYLDARPLFETVAIFAHRLAQYYEQLEETSAYRQAFAGTNPPLHSTQLRDTQKLIKDMTPARLCPACGGESRPEDQPCQPCANKGYLTNAEAAKADAAVQEAIA
jgi:hypothetical protein